MAKHLGTGSSNKRRWFTFSKKDCIKTILCLTAATLLSFIVMFLSKGEHTTINVAVLYILAIVAISGSTEGYLYGIFAATIGVIGVNYFFTYPFFKLDFTLDGYPLTFICMLLSSLITCTLTNRMQEQARIAIARENRTEALYSFNKKLLTLDGEEKIATYTLQCIFERFGCSGVFYIGYPRDPNCVKITQDQGVHFYQLIGLESELNSACWAFESKRSFGSPKSEIGMNKGFYVPVITQQKVLGVIGIFGNKHLFLAHQNRIFLNMTITQTAMAMARQQLSDERGSIVVESEKEKMRCTLLRAISHDLRAPLADIAGASAEILKNGDTLKKAEHDKLVSDIYEDSQWLIRMVENLLSVTRTSDK